MRRRAITFSAAAALALLAAQTAEARGWRSHNWSATGPRGGTWTHSASRYHNGGGNFGQTRSTTAPDGRTASTSFNRSVDGGVITDTRSQTGFGGATRSETLTRTPGQGGEATYTGRGGNTYTATFGP